MSGENDGATVISKHAVKRLIKDIKSLKYEPLTEHGIYYQHSEDDILKGQAMIIGPIDTPYEHGFYLFDIMYPPDYPHKPPVVKFCTNDGVTRMHPNLYKCGKVCVSILNTWRGDAWTGCQTISTVLLTLVSLLNSEPLLNEPGITSEHHDFNTYNNIIKYKNVETAIHMVLTSKHIQKHYSCFVPIMNSYFIDKYENILSATVNAQKHIPTHMTTSIYRMNITTYYDDLITKLETLYNKLAKLK